METWRTSSTKLLGRYMDFTGSRHFANMELKNWTGLWSNGALIIFVILFSLCLGLAIKLVHVLIYRIYLYALIYVN